jgi:hypothetical protein
VEFDKPVVFGVLKIDSIRIGVCWDMTHCRSADERELSGGNCCLHLYYDVSECSLQRRVLRDFSHADCLNALKFFFEIFLRVTLRYLQILIFCRMTL